MSYKRRINKNKALEPGNKCVLINQDQGFPAGMAVTVLEPKRKRKGHRVKVKNTLGEVRRIRSTYLKRENEIK